MSRVSSGDPVERLGDQLLELLARHLQHEAIVGDDRSVREAGGARISGRPCGHRGSMARVPTAVMNLIHRFPRLPQALTRRHRSGTRPPAAPALAPGARPRPWVRALGLVAVVMLGAWLGLLVVGNVRVPVGPMDTTMTLRPSFTGGTKINVSPWARCSSTATSPRCASTSTSTSSTPSAPGPSSTTPSVSRGSRTRSPRTSPAAPRTSPCAPASPSSPAPPRSGSSSTAARAAPWPPEGSPSACWPRPAARRTRPGTRTRCWSRSSPACSPPRPRSSATRAASSPSSTSTRRSWPVWSPT